MSEVTGTFLIDLCLLKVVTCSVNEDPVVMNDSSISIEIQRNYFCLGSVLHRATKNHNGLKHSARYVDF